MVQSQTGSWFRKLGSGERKQGIQVKKTVQVRSLSRVDENDEEGRLTPWPGESREVGVGESAANRRHFDEDADWDMEDHAIGKAPHDMV